jgi:hypothetical protein
MSQNKSVSEMEFRQVADRKFNEMIEDVYYDFSKNYLNPQDLINQTYSETTTKWTFSASLFFAWTAITTIGDI